MTGMDEGLEVVTSRPFDGMFVLDALWRRLGVAGRGAIRSTSNRCCSRSTSSARSCAPRARKLMPPARQGRYRIVESNLHVKQVRIDAGVNRDRFVTCHNPKRAECDRTVREQILKRLRQ